jgi:hypothetical protein
MIATAVAADAVVVLLYLAAPHMIGPMEVESPKVASWLFAAGAVVAHVVGYLWMIRIYRADPEASPSAWRSHRS